MREVPRSLSKTSTPIEIAHATSSGPRSRGRGKVIPRNRLPAVVNRSRLVTRNEAKKTTSRDLGELTGLDAHRSHPHPDLGAVDLGERRGQHGGQHEQHEADEASGVAEAGQRAVVAHVDQDDDEQRDAHRDPRHLLERVLARDLVAARGGPRNLGEVDPMDHDQAEPVEERDQRQDQRVGVGGEAPHREMGDGVDAEEGEPEVEQRGGEPAAPGWPPRARGRPW